MSLISGANFVAPLRSKAQIVGIFALAALVAVIRLSSSHSTSEESGSSPASAYKAASSAAGGLEGDVDSYLASRKKALNRGSDGAGGGDDAVDKLFASGGSDGSSRRAKPQPSDDRSAEPEKLNDIARSLGLE